MDRSNRYRSWHLILFMGLFTLLWGILTLPIQANAEEEQSTTPSLMEEFKNRDFVIDAYDIHIHVNENNEMDITEKLTVFFNKEKHGIYRTLPLKNTVRRMDGTMTNNRARVKKLSVNDDYNTEYDNGNLVIRIGDADETVKGKKEYTISYTYKLGRDPLEGKDEFYFNILGTEWTTVIGNVTFTIEMPKPFDEKRLGFSAGWENSADSTGVSWNVSGQTITGSYNGILKSGQALTVRLELQEGYFVGAGLENRVLDIVCFSFPVIFLIISLILWFRFGRDDMLVETVEFYPPEGINSLDAGYYYKGEVHPRDVTSLLIYLANQGYLRIEETEEKEVFKKKKTFKIIRLREYDGKDPNEKKFMSGLFSGAKEENGFPTVTPGTLYNSFYKTTNQITTSEQKKASKIFEGNTSRKSALIMLMILLSSVLITIPPVFTYDLPDTIFVILFPIVGFGLFFAIILGGRGRGHRKGKIKKLSIGSALLAIAIGGLFGLLPVALVIYPLLLESTFHMIGFIVGCVCIFFMIILFVYMPKRTAYGIEMLGRLEGFRNFLMVAEKEQLEKLVMQDPQYFYRILPYTYVLGVSDTWVKKFEEIQMQAPEWYVGSVYSIYGFHDTMDRTMATASRAMTSSPHESSGSYSGGGFSGGGFSGGGSGGGGGGAW